MGAYVGIENIIYPVGSIFFYYIQCKRCGSISYGCMYWCECGSDKIRILSYEQVYSTYKGVGGALPDILSEYEYGFLLGE